MKRHSLPTPFDIGSGRRVERFVDQLLRQTSAGGGARLGGWRGLASGVGRVGGPWGLGGCVWSLAALHILRRLTIAFLFLLGTMHGRPSEYDLLYLCIVQNVIWHGIEATIGLVPHICMIFRQYAYENGRLIGLILDVNSYAKCRHVLNERMNESINQSTIDM